eukprot:3695562-Prymnesium_polylepis.1
MASVGTCRPSRRRTSATWTLKWYLNCGPRRLSIDRRGWGGVNNLPTDTSGLTCTGGGGRWPMLSPKA